MFSASTDQDEYINANFIDGHDRSKAFIGTQFPLHNTLNGFYHMVWNQNVHVIVTLTNLNASRTQKCYPYWPEYGKKYCGVVLVDLKNEQDFGSYIVRNFQISYIAQDRASDLEPRTILQYHYKNWPDHGVPSNALEFANFVKASSQANPIGAGPVVVHCNNGVERTGVYIVVHEMLRQIQTHSDINISQYLLHIRSQRANLVGNNMKTYMFIYDALVDAIKSNKFFD